MNKQINKHFRLRKCYETMEQDGRNRDKLGSEGDFV